MIKEALGLTLGLVGALALAGSTASAANKITMPEYSEKDVTVKTYKGDFVQHQVRLNGGDSYDLRVLVLTSLFQGNYLFVGSIPAPYVGDFNGDGKFDWETTMTLVDRNHDGKPDIVKVLTTCDGKYFRYLDSGEIAKKDFRGVAAWVDDDFDGRLDRYVTDCLNEKGRNNPDGRWDDEVEIKKGRKMEDMAKPKFLYIDAKIIEETPEKPQDRRNEKETFDI